MTREEAIKELSYIADEMPSMECADWKEAISMAIKALEQEPTTKNDLGVDWESYKDVDGNSLDDLILDVIQRNFDCGNTYGYKVADEIIGLLPSVTPQEPILEKDGTLIVTTEHCEKVGRVLVQYGTNGTLFYQDQELRKGHWIEHPHECGINWEYPMYECSECHGWTEDDSDFCPNCGVDMREVKE